MIEILVVAAILAIALLATYVAGHRVGAFDGRKLIGSLEARSADEAQRHRELVDELLKEIRVANNRAHGHLPVHPTEVQAEVSADNTLAGYSPAAREAMRAQAEEMEMEALQRQVNAEDAAYAEDMFSEEVDGG